MNKSKRKESYEPPKMEFLEIMTEQAVLNASVDDWGNGGSLSGGEAEETDFLG